jgi:hypothetical protein
MASTEQGPGEALRGAALHAAPGWGVGVGDAVPAVQKDLFLTVFIGLCLFFIF